MNATTCKARISINGYAFECQCVDGHTSSHAAQVRTGLDIYSTFDWDIDDTGIVAINMPAGVMRYMSTWGHNVVVDGYPDITLFDE